MGISIPFSHEHLFIFYPFFSYISVFFCILMWEMSVKMENLMFLFLFCFTKFEWNFVFFLLKCNVYSFIEMRCFILRNGNVYFFTRMRCVFTEKRCCIFSPDFYRNAMYIGKWLCFFFFKKECNIFLTTLKKGPLETIFYISPDPSPYGNYFLHSTGFCGM